MYRASLQTASDSDALCCPSEYTSSAVRTIYSELSVVWSNQYTSSAVRTLRSKYETHTLVNWRVMRYLIGGKLLLKRITAERSSFAGGCSVVKSLTTKFVP